MKKVSHTTISESDDEIMKSPIHLAAYMKRFYEDFDMSACLVVDYIPLNDKNHSAGFESECALWYNPQTEKIYFYEYECRVHPKGYTTDDFIVNKACLSSVKEFEDFLADKSFHNHLVPKLKKFIASEREKMLQDQLEHKSNSHSVKKI